VRKCVEVSGFRLSDSAPFDTGSGSSDCSLGEFLLRPTTIYVSRLLPLVQRGLIKGLAHITGGGVLDNIPRVLPEHLAVAIDVESCGWRLPGVFQWLQSIARLSQDQLLRTFNCGVGMVVIVAACDAEVVWTELTAHDAPLLRLGSVVSRNNDGAQVIISGQLV
jgi:phosphoribosylaminoimidazole (AIR) synthetase